MSQTKITNYLHQIAGIKLGGDGGFFEKHSSLASTCLRVILPDKSNLTVKYSAITELHYLPKEEEIVLHAHSSFVIQIKGRGLDDLHQALEKEEVKSLWVGDDGKSEISRIVYRSKQDWQGILEN